MRRPEDRVRITAEAPLSLESLVAVAEGAGLEVGPTARRRMEAGRAVVDRALAGGQSVYGLTTGLGHTRDQRVPDELMAGYQERIVLGHRAAVGDPLPTEIVRAAMAARVNGMALGSSGATPAAADTLVAMLNSRVHPVVPEVGSVGASDLMHMAAVAAVAIGWGWAEHEGTVLPGAEALARADISPLRPQPKDGLALISANAVASGHGAMVVTRAASAAEVADLTAALALEAYGANLSIVDPVVAEAKPTPGHRAAAEHLRGLLRGSRLDGSGDRRSIQDPLSFRVIPQVHGAMRQAVAWCHSAVEGELNSVDDNPMVVADEDRLVHNGNFCPIGLALAFDALRPALAHGALCSVRRMGHLTRLGWERDPGGEKWSGTSRPRPPGLLVYTAAALWAELRHLAGPATLDITSLDLEVEDHATSAPLTVRTAERTVGLVEEILTCELLTASLAVEGAEPAPRLGSGPAAARALIGELLDPLGLDQDAAMAHRVVLAAVRDGSLLDAAHEAAGHPGRWSGRAGW